MTDAKVRANLLMLGAIVLPVLATITAAILVPDTNNGLVLIAFLISLAIGAAATSAAIDGFWTRVGGSLTYVLVMTPICFMGWMTIGCGLHGECL
ncbi:hypothetical protein HFP57_10865 [Parasphingopyxis algicola]|uniref:hypothetical protein n=1 Tax=Parasphingopyxis algicola TaxID=2026624 RepID=UPI0015A46721|nr:hypothetical protein [Parasphingopyxis algicola]QLC25469.1 hypothetical protein HFP57_10865 [Parasphingopyxis algicola]